MRYIKAENLKYKHTIINRLLLIAPFVTVLFAFLAGGVNIFQSTGLYWWYMFILQGFIAVLCLASIRTEELSGHTMLVYALPVDLKKLRMAKNLVLVSKLFIANLVLALLLVLVPRFLFPNYISYTLTELLLGNAVIVLTSIWQIPLCLMMISKFGIFVPIALNTLLGLITIVFMGNTSFWYVWPYCWPAKEMETLLKIGINGVPKIAELGNGYVNIIVIIMAVIVFLLLAYLDAKLFERTRE